MESLSSFFPLFQCLCSAVVSEKQIYGDSDSAGFIRMELAFRIFSKCVQMCVNDVLLRASLKGLCNHPWLFLTLIFYFQSERPQGLFNISKTIFNADVYLTTWWFAFVLLYISNWDKVSKLSEQLSESNWVGVNKWKRLMTEGKNKQLKLSRPISFFPHTFLTPPLKQADMPWQTLLFSTEVLIMNGNM